MTGALDRILVVDDEPENIWPLVKHLENEFEVLCATNGEQALQIASSEKKVDLILLDIIMPGMDGYTVCSRLKAEESTRNIPVIFLTAKKEEIDETKGLELGAQDYITKPYSLPVVRARIKSLLNLKKELEKRLLLKTQLEQLNVQLEAQVKERMEELQKARDALTVYEEKYHHLFQERQNGIEMQRLLIVDDNPENVHILIRSLQSSYEIICATDGKTALEKAFSEKPPDLILLDVMMPEMDGFEVCSRLKANPDTWGIPVIFVTALGQELDETKGLDLGAVDFITKPFSLPIAEARIKAALRLKEEMDQRIRLTRKLEDLNKDLEARIRRKTAALKQAHEELRTSEKRYRGIFENAPEGIFQTSIEGRFLDANPAMARILGYSSPKELLAELTDIRHQLYAHPEERDSFLGLLEQQTAIAGHELQFLRKDKKVVWVSISSRIVRDDSGNPLFLEGFLTDITLRKQMEEQLRQAAKMEAIGNLVGGVAHDFNNLMTAVIGYGEIVLRRMEADDPSRSAIDLMKKAGEKAAMLTHRLLAFSRKQVLQPMIGEDIELVTVLDPNLRKVLVDPGQIDQVIMNLAVNARDAMPEGGKLTIKTADVFLDDDYCRQHVDVQPGQYSMLAVSDNGIGMDAETLSHMFEPFFTTKARHKGTGLGLAMVYGIVKQNHGHIWVYSEKGKGSTFRIFFPVIALEAEAQAPSRESSADYRGTETVMIAEDNISVRDLAAEILMEQGYTVLTAESGECCLNLLRDHRGPLDLLLTDVVMPDMNGRILFQKVTERFPSLKVLFMSGYTDNIIVQHGVLDEGIQFIQKPFSIQALAAKVRDVLIS
jgi:two-component system cell cycle sensor histidine kinase/response regulator CckA